MAVEKTTGDGIDLERRTEMKAFGYGRMWCAACGCLTSMVTVGQAAALTSLTVDALLERINNRGLHSMRIVSGEVLFCLNSFNRSSKSISERRGLGVSRSLMKEQL